MKSYS
jgi:hypothetical protein